MNIEKINGNSEETQNIDHSEVNANIQKYIDIVDKYVMGEPIERDVYFGPMNKIKAVLRAPAIGVVHNIYRDIAKNAGEGYVNLQVESSASMLSAYIREINGKDYAHMYGDKYDDQETKQLIREDLEKTLIEPLRDLLINEILLFIEDIKKAFSDKYLDFT